MYKLDHTAFLSLNCNKALISSTSHFPHKHFSSNTIICSIIQYSIRLCVIKTLFDVMTLKPWLYGFGRAF